jgi:hypothetical protein
VRPCADDATLQGDVDDALAPYRVSGKYPIRECTVLCLSDRPPIAIASEDEWGSLFPLVDALTFAALANRRFFGHDYWNKDDLTFVVQGVQERGRGTLLDVRRRDGTTRVHVTRDAHIVVQPRHVLSRRVEIDPALLSAATSAMLGDERNLQEALISFNAANSDSPDVARETELVLMNGALERLFQIDVGKEHALVGAFMAHITPTESLAPVDVHRIVATHAFRQRFDNVSTVRECWVRDFYRLRNDHAHGRRHASYPSCWNLLSGRARRVGRRADVHPAPERERPRGDVPPADRS